MTMNLGGVGIMRATRSAAALIVLVALAWLLVASNAPPVVIVMDDFESATVMPWQAVSNGPGHWQVYPGGKEPSDPGPSARDIPVRLPDPPQGSFAAATEMTGPGTHILYRDLRLDGRFRIDLTVFWAGAVSFSSPKTLDSHIAEANQQFRVDLIPVTAPIDSVADDDVLANIFRTSSRDPVNQQPTEVGMDLSKWQGHTVRLRLAVTANRGPLRAAVDDIRFQSIGRGAGDEVQFPVTEKASSAVDLILGRMTEADALAALSEYAEQRTRADQFSGAVLVARHGHALLEHAWGLADRQSGKPNTPATRFRLGSMNKMFTAVATLQLVEDGKLALDDPVGKHLPDYPNADVAAKVTVRHLLTHTGGTGDIFGQEFYRNRLELREHSDYVALYGKRGLTHQPGTRFDYSNYGFVLLGKLIEQVSGQSYYDYVRDNIFRPAGMTSTDSLPESEDVPDRAVGYQRSGEAWVPNDGTLPWRGTAAGGGYSTVGDLGRFAQALSSGALISQALLGEATSPHQQNYGYGFETREEGPLSSYGHGGGAPGMNGMLMIFPRLGFVVVGLSNLDPPAASELVAFFMLRMPAE